MSGLASYRAEMAAAAERLARPAVDVHEVMTDGGVVQFARYGSGQPVLVLHGSGGGWDQGVDWARRRLAADAAPGFDVIGPARFGYLGSSLPQDADVRAQSSALITLLDHLCVERADVVGVSAGSVAALQLAADHPDRVRRLVLESPLLPRSGRAPLPPLPVARALSRAQFAIWLTTRMPPTVTLAAGAPRRELSAADREELDAINATMFPLRPRRGGMIFDRAVSAPHVLADRIPVERITAPVLVVNAAHALLAPHDDAVRFVSRLSDAELLEPDHGGHVLIGNVQRLRDAVSGFLAR